MTKNKFYAVVRGTKPGIYNSWYGEDGAELQINGFPNALHKGFKTRTEAEEWYSKNRDTSSSSDKAAKSIRTRSGIQVESEPETARRIMNDDRPVYLPKIRKVIFYTDGGCSGNPGPGGYGVVCVRGKFRKEFSGGFRKTTNNRMELMACVIALRSLKSRYAVTLYSDSKYVVDGINQGWAERWQARDWMRTKTDKAENVDLWSELLEICSMHRVTLQWVKGHAGNSENERCDRLALMAMSKKGLPPDINYEQGRTQTMR